MFRRSLTLVLACGAVSASGYAQSDSTTNFDDMKAQIVARLEKELSCAQAATTSTELQACRPQPPSGARQGPPPSQ